MFVHCIIHKIYILSLCSIDATDEPKREPCFGRLVNHGEKTEINAKMKLLEMEGKPILALFALRNIQEGEEIRYCYGVKNLPWKKTQVSILYWRLYVFRIFLHSFAIYMYITDDFFTSNIKINNTCKFIGN